MWVQFLKVLEHFEVFFSYAVGWGTPLNVYHFGRVRKWFSMAPVLWRPTKSRNPYNVKPFLTDISATVAQIQKIQKTRCIFFRILLLVGPSPPSQLVPNPFNWSPNTVFTDISATVAQIQKFQKARCICFRILLLGGPSPPSPLVPNPFFFSTYIYGVLKFHQRVQITSSSS